MGGGITTVKPPERVVVCPPGFVTVTSCGPCVAVTAIVRATDISVGDTTVNELTVIPAPKLRVAPGSKLAPRTATLRLEPRFARSGERLAMIGTPGLSSAVSARSTWIRGFAVPVPARVSVIVSPVLARARRISSTLAAGTACFRIAHAPATWGAAIDVPLATANWPPGYDEMISSPGASRDKKGAAFEKSAIRSSLVVAPTLTVVEMQAGALS